MQGLCAKRDLFLHLVSSKVYDVLAFTESHLLSMPANYADVCRAMGYNILFSPASKSHAAGRASGGIVTLVRNSL